MLQAVRNIMTKVTTRGDQEIYEIAVKQPASMTPSPVASPPPCENHTNVVMRLKQKLSATVAKITATKTVDATKKKTSRELPASDWPSNRPMLRNLTLLKQYLTFVSQEAGACIDIVPKDGSHTISITMPTSPIDSHGPSADSSLQQAARMGANLVEAMVHDSVEMEKRLLPLMSRKSHAEHPSPNPVSRGPADRRRPGRPPKSVYDKDDSGHDEIDEDENENEHEHEHEDEKEGEDDEEDDDNIRRRRYQYKVQKRPVHRRKMECNRKKTQKQGQKDKQHMIQCICDTPHEEFGSMVQCDDCFSWLHLECLDLNDEALDETFRCPSCYIALGAGKQVNISAVTWRFAAQFKSQRLAAAARDPDWCTSDEDEDSEGYDAFNAHESGTDSDMDDGDLASMDSPSLVNWVDNSSEEHFEQRDDTESPSEASTPEQFDDMMMDYELDAESLDLLSRLVYIHSIDSVKKVLFAPNASDVFFCEGTSVSVPVSTPATFVSDIPPSTICSQELSHFSFERGPFWERLL
ncbi:hypothetical protein DFQ28_011477 [Apophysomyces sp. BC1034]|nr:hypothetical protein DFQ30_011341 [Apophysomyces sp. BC1015]KAG0169003.1 hypothetical protein DFQ29_009929 [Apophysomyces sp. BC1021]KAG0184273.1 hypothetical protein DFQ28_011477 [Apophysomyces sp. BC1034]